MTPGNENSGKKLVWEPPQLMRLTAPGDARGQCNSNGSGDDSNCLSNGNNATSQCNGVGNGTDSCSTGNNGGA
jgi:hypothetical protein